MAFSLYKTRIETETELCKLNFRKKVASAILRRAICVETRGLEIRGPMLGGFWCGTITYTAYADLVLDSFGG